MRINAIWVLKHAATTAQAEGADNRVQADRTVLTDAMWTRMEDIRPGKATDPGGTAADNRQLLSRQIVAVTDARGYRARFAILPGQAHDLTGGGGGAALLEGLPFPALIGDRAFDADWLVAEAKGRGAAPVMPSPRHRTEPRDHDREMYQGRHRSENFFARIKEFRAVAAHCDKTDKSFAAAIHLVAGGVAAA